MSEYLYFCEAAGTSVNLYYAVMGYIPKEFHSNLDLSSFAFKPEPLNVVGDECIQLMFNKSPVNMRMYGTPKELAENIKIFKNFPGSHRYFSEVDDLFFTTPIIHQSLKNEKFISKSDLFVMLQSMMLRSFGAQLSGVVSLICCFFLKANEKRVGPEFVPFDKKAFDEIWREIQNFRNEMESPKQGRESLTLLSQESKSSSHQDRFNRLKSYIPNEWSQKQSGTIELTLRIFVDHLQSTNPGSASMMIASSFASSKVLTGILQRIIKKRPEMFLPNSGKTPVTVRLFEDGDEKFVMKAELFNALNIKYKDPDNIFDTISFQDALGAYKDKLSYIEFIRYPIQRAKHRAVPINGVDRDDPNEFCILAVDALLEHLRSLIFGHQLFQKCQITDWKPVKVLFDSFEVYFKPDYEHPYFLGTNGLDTLELTVKNQLTHTEMLPPKIIRNAKSDGFTVQNLKNELAYLNLTTIFPEIQDHAEVVYAYVDKVKKEKYLRTCDLYDALEYCQLICIFERFPNFKKFLHNQGGCGRVPGLKCDLCDGKKKNDEEPKDALKLEGSEISEIESNSQTTLKTVISSYNSDSKSSEVLKATDSKIEAADSHITELNAKIASLEAQLASQAEKSAKIESDILKKSQENEELHLSNVKLQSENEANKGVISQLIDKLSIKGTMKESAICLN